MDAELDQLIDALLSDRAYASGRRRFPRTVTMEQALEMVKIAHEQIDVGTAARQKSADRDGVVIACKAGCNGCCEELILVLSPEAELVARWLQRPENAAIKAGFLERYPAWRERIGDGAERLIAFVVARDSEGQLEQHKAQWRKRILCAFNHEGLCTIYPVRPTVCRNGHAVDTAERCVGDNPGLIPATRLLYKPLDDFMANSRQLEMAAHNAIGGTPNRPEALCEVVAKKLQQGQ